MGEFKFAFFCFGLRLAALWPLAGLVACGCSDGSGSLTKPERQTKNTDMKKFIAIIALAAFACAANAHCGKCGDDAKPKTCEKCKDCKDGCKCQCHKKAEEKH